MTKRYKALISDFDNTLVDISHTVSPEVKDAIIKLQEQGVIFTIATGRFFYGTIRQVAKELKLQNPLITSGGAELVDPKTENVIWGEYIPYIECKELIDYLRKKDLFFLVEANKTLYKSNQQTVHRFDIGANYDILENMTAETISKIVIPAGLQERSLAEITEMEDYLTSKFKDLHIIKIMYNGHYGFDITSTKASKHIGVLEFMKIMNLKPEEVIGMGDGYNDYPLLTACGVKVAMGDAPEELKAIADFIAPPQSENGILRIIEKYF